MRDEILTDKEVLDRIPQEELEEALRFYKDFHWGFEPDKLYPIKRHVFPPTVSLLGYLRAEIYQTTKRNDGKDSWYLHVHHPAFPMLASDVNGNQLYIIGGDYRVEPRGIVG